MPGRFENVPISEAHDQLRTAFDEWITNDEYANMKTVGEVVDAMSIAMVEEIQEKE